MKAELRDLVTVHTLAGWMVDRTADSSELKLGLQLAAKWAGESAAYLAARWVVM